FVARSRRHTRFSRDWGSDVCSSDLLLLPSLDVRVGEVIGDDVQLDAMLQVGLRRSEREGETLHRVTGRRADVIARALEALVGDVDQGAFRACLVRPLPGRP